MVLVVSRFRVVNGREGEVRQAFLDRPRLVDGVPGFLGMETFIDRADGAVFVLVTRWTDHASYEQWHRSAEHHASHAFMPRGLKLDAAATRLEALERIEPAAGPTDEDRARDMVALLARAVASSARLYVLVAGIGGTLQWCNPCASATLGPGAAAGRPIWPLLTGPSAALLRARVEAGRRDVSRFLLNFLGPDGAPFTVDSFLDVRGDAFAIAGDGPAADEVAALASLSSLTEELAALAAEHARRGAELAAARTELERALEDLRTSHWHLRRIQEVLPICVDCRRVKTDEARWEDVADYLKQNSTFLSHGYCPECGARALEKMRGERERLR